MQKSIFWTTGTTGDGTSTYTQSELFAWMKRTLLGAPNSEGVLKGYAGDLAVTGTSSPLSVAAGAAVVNGIPYENDAPVDVEVPTPLVGTTGFRVVLRADYTAQTVRIALKISQDGVITVPALDQLDGTIWEISLATGTITVGGVIELTDTRQYAHFRTAVDTSMLDDGSVTSAKLASGAAAANIGNGAITNAMLANNAVTLSKMADNSVGTSELVDGSVTTAKLANGAVNASKLADNSVTSAKIVDGTIQTSDIADGAITSAKIANGTITTADIANDAVDDTKVGARVPQFIRRRGGSATDWSAPGATNFTPGAVRMQGGVITINVDHSNTTTSVFLAFPVAFSDKPIIFCNPLAMNFPGGAIINASATSGVGANISVVLPAGTTTYGPGTTPVSIQWLAIGPE